MTHRRNALTSLGFGTLTALICLLPVLRAEEAKDPDPARFAGEIEAFHSWDARNAIPAHAVLFVGSSTIRLWRTAEAFPDLPVLNRGFGGAQFSDLLHFRQDVLLKIPEPACIVLYCGDNDIAGGKTADRVAQDFRAFVAAAQQAFPRTPLIYLAIKPSRSRWAIWPEQQRANGLIADLCRADPRLHFADIAPPMLATGNPPAENLFAKDGLHLNDEGYALWTRLLRPLIDQALKSPAP